MPFIGRIVPPQRMPVSLQALVRRRARLGTSLAGLARRNCGAFTMASALFSFHDRDAARRAADRLIEQGLPTRSVTVHIHDNPTNSTAAEVDELVTGGLTTNLYGLFQGLFEWGSSDHDPSAYAETVKRGGAVVSVNAETDSQRAAVDQVMQTAGSVQRTDWSRAPAG
jgi:hypothetical protein